MIGGRTIRGRAIRLLMLLLVATAAMARSQDVRPGDQVRCIARDQHIPAHPAAGDSRVHLRSLSGSAAAVLRVYAATGWVEVRGEPGNADLTALTQDMPISCRDNSFTEFIDHLVVDRRVLPWVDRTSFRQVTYRQADKGVWDRLSDHCPVLVELWIR
jgi:hypothetical protein